MPLTSARRQVPRWTTRQPRHLATVIEQLYPSRFILIVIDLVIEDDWIIVES
jgi:hypothetical protein